MNVKMPPLMFALVLLFWAWQGGHWALGVAAALWLEWAIRTPRRWHLADRDIHRGVDLTGLALVAVAIYRYNDGPFAQALFAMLHWAPLLFLPLLSAQLLSGRQGLERRALFYSQRNSTDPSARRELDLRFPYIAACLMAAGQDALEPRAYFPLLALFFAGLLWWNRPPGRRIQAWLPLLGLSALLGYLGQIGLRQAQTQLENAAVDWLSAFFSGDTDPYRASTAFGDIGTLKLSGRILYRVETPTPLNQALLLRTAAYNRYVDSTWFSSDRTFNAIQPDPRTDAWQWGRAPNAVGTGGSALISAYLEDKRSLLPLPTGAWRIEGLPVTGLARHPMGSLRAEEGPGLVRYRVWYDQAAATDAPPQEADLRVPRPEQHTLAQVVEQLGLATMNPEHASRRIQDYFQQQFRYSLELPGKQPGKTALGHFLLDRRRGHCEYFASASVLLLRQVGIPARYAVGYSTQESDGRPNHYLVRHSHAHAWTLVWHHGQWWDLDTTPAIWYSFEAEQTPFWQPLLDLFSNLYYRYALDRLAGGGEGQNPWLWALLALLFLALGYRLRPGQAFRRTLKEKHPLAQPPSPSSLGAIEAVLGQAGFPRQPWETHGDWLQRLRQQPALAEIGEGLEEIRQLHYRFRYRDAGLDADELARMKQLADDWLRRWDGRSSPWMRRAGRQQ